MSWRRIIDSSALAIGLIAAMGVVYAVVARYVLHGFPLSGDEYSTWLQSELFANGLLKSPAPPHAEWLGFDHVIIDEWVRSKYPPGASVLLAPGQWFDAAWIVTPIEGTITLAILWRVVRKLYGAGPALAAVIILGVSPLFVATTTSFYAHTPTLMFLTGAFAAIVSWLDSRRDVALVLAGCAIGCAFVTRPFDALLFGAAMASLRSWRALIVTALGALPLVALNMLYQYLQFGSPFVTGYWVYEPAFRAIYGDLYVNPLGLEHFLSAQQQVHHVEIFKQMLIMWTPIGAAALAVFARGQETTSTRDLVRTFCVALLVFNLLAFLFAIAEPDDGPRARYLTITLLPLTILAAEGAVRVWAWARARRLAVVMCVVAAASVAYAIHYSHAYLRNHEHGIFERSAPYRLVKHVPPNSVVIVRARFPTRYARNGPFFDGVLFLSVPPDVSDEQVRAAYPDRPIWSAREARPWKFRRVQ